MLVARPDGASHRFDETACDRKTKPGTGLHIITFPHTIECIEHMLQIVRRNSWASIRNFQRYAGRACLSPDPDWRILRCVFSCIVEQIEQGLLKQNGVKLNHRQI